MEDIINFVYFLVRMGAALALTAIGDQKSFRYLETATSDENEFVQKIAKAITKKYQVGVPERSKSGISKISAGANERYPDK